MGQKLRKIAKETKAKVHGSNSKTPANNTTIPTPPPVILATPAPAPAPAPALTTSPISLSPMDSSTMDAALVGVAAALNGKFRYLVIGGVALSRLGAGQRATKDLDLLVPDDTLLRVAEALVATGNFGAEQRGSVPRMWFKAPNGKNYNVDIIEPKKLHSAVKFPSDSASVQETGTVARIMLPAKLLNLKILAYVKRKKQTDHQDIVNLVRWMFTKGKKTSQKEVIYADDDFLIKMTAGKDADTVKQWGGIGLAPPNHVRSPSNVAGHTDVHALSVDLEVDEIAGAELDKVGNSQAMIDSIGVYDPDLAPTVEDVLAACAGLVVHQPESDIVQLVHKTTKEYLLSDDGRRKWFPKAQLTIAAICLVYAQAFENGDAAADWPFLDYAQKQYGHHREKGEGPTPVQSPRQESALESSSSFCKAQQLIDQIGLTRIAQELGGMEEMLLLACEKNLLNLL